MNYLLGLIVDPEDARKVSGILEEVRVGLAERPWIAADLTFADEAVPQLRQLVTARADHLTATEMLTAAEAAATGLRLALVAAAQRASLDKDTQAEVARIQGERALAERRAGDMRPAAVSSSAASPQYSGMWPLKSCRANSPGSRPLPKPSWKRGGRCRGWPG